VLGDINFNIKTFEDIVRNGEYDSFSRNHTTPYTAIALQELNLYYRYPNIYWNTACLTVNSGSAESDEEEVQKATDYAKVAIAIGDIQSQGVKVSLADINRSSFSFKPDIYNNEIIFGLKGINGIGDDVVNDIIKNRPYTSIEDLESKVKLNKKAMLNLIKAGAFDNLQKGKERTEIMMAYIHSVSNEKKRLTLQNFNGLIEANLIPEDLSFVVRVYKYTKILKKFCKDGEDFLLNNEQLLSFFEENFDTSLLEVRDNTYTINQKVYDKLIYQKQMDKARAWLKTHHDETLAIYNNMLFQQEWEKYCGNGNISAWEMDSISFYYHEHELAHINKQLYGISNFNDLPYDPVVDYTFSKAGKDIPIFKLTRIVGTVISKNKIKGTINLLTTDGVVMVRFRKEMFAAFDKQLSEKQEDGTKKITEKSWFNKGNKLMITGYRREDQFVPKKYAKTNGHTLYKIEEIHDNGTIELRNERDG
jgi:DNA polymerase-3 subunit alpha